MPGMIDSGSSFDPLISAGGGALGSMAGNLSRDSASGDQRRKLGEVVNMLSGMSAQNVQVYSPDGSRLVRMRVLAARGGGGNASASHPFRVEQRLKAGSSSQYEYQVTDGKLLRSFIPNSEASITGLNTWKSANTTDHIWLDIDISFYNVTTVTVKTGNDFNLSAPAFSTGAFIEATDNGDVLAFQSKLRVLIATIAPDDENPGGPPAVAQRVFGNLVMSGPFPIGYDGRACFIAMPSPY